MGWLIFSADFSWIFQWVFFVLGTCFLSVTYWRAQFYANWIRQEKKGLVKRILLEGLFLGLFYAFSVWICIGLWRIEWGLLLFWFAIASLIGESYALMLYAILKLYYRMMSSQKKRPSL